MRLIDTHAHIYLPEFEVDRELMLERAEKQGITKILMPAIDSGSHQQLLDLEKAHPKQCIAMMGLHPCSVKEGNMVEELKIVESYLRSRPFIAVGEIGIDLYWDKSTLSIQQEAFRSQIGWAKQMGLPIVIHCREAFDEIFEILDELKDDKLRGIFHCFTGDAAQAEKVISLGFYLGIGGVLTYKNSGLDKVVQDISLEHLVLETDSPYLTPVPFRGKQNESSYLVYVAQKLADLKQIPIEELARITTLNSERVFGV